MELTQRTSRGFSVMHLVVALPLLVVLVVLAGAGYVRFLRTAKTGEAAQMIANIKGAQETYRAETLGYLDVSVNLDRYFPTAPPIQGNVPWDTSACTVDPCKGFRVLNVKADGSVAYRYSVIAGVGDGVARTIDGIAFTAHEPWFVVKARGDTNQDGRDGLYWSASFRNYIWSQNPDE